MIKSMYKWKKINMSFKDILQLQIYTHNNEKKNTI